MAIIRGWFSRRTVVGRADHSFPRLPHAGTSRHSLRGRASLRAVYGLIADDRKGHPSILPPQYFENLEVEEGGYGAGTRIRFTMLSYGTRRVCRAHVTEPEPGRVLVETDIETGTSTRFVPRYLDKVYARELELLAERAVRGHVTPAP
ncbi:MAG: hypothetical protein ABI647_26730 [Gemmatimonadota bacterium]